ncbi:MAG: hypothetical protein R3C53_28110 [Pirellulaceae bacterium]
MVARRKLAKMWRIDQVIAQRGSHELLWCSQAGSPQTATYFGRRFVGDRQAAEFDYFERLAVICATGNPCFPPLIAHDLDAQQPLLIFSRLNAQTMGDWLAAQTLSPAKPLLVWLARQLLESLSGLHRLGYVHGNVRPEHLLIDDLERVKLIGLGKCTEVGMVMRLARARTRYDAPEVATGGFECSSAQDVYAAAVVVAELVGECFTRSPVAQAMLACDPADRPVATEVVQLLCSLENELFTAYMQRAA